MTDTQDSKRRKRPSHKKHNWKVSLPHGGSLTSVGPVFSPDHKFLIVLTTLEVRLYSFAARQCVAKVAIEEAHLAVDLFVYSEPSAHEKTYPAVWIAKRNNQLLYVDWKHDSIKTISFKSQVNQVLHKIVNVLDEAKMFVLAVTEQNHDDISFIRITPDGSTPVNKIVSVANVTALALSHTKSHFIAKHGNPSFGNKKSSSQNERFTIARFNNEYDGVEKTNIERGRRSSAIAVSDSGIVAIGSVTGVIDLYYLNSDDALEYHISPKNFIIRTLKWHMEPVRALAFSLNGDYLLSGGNEKVLLFWQLDTGNVQFLPRLPGPITNVVVDNSSTMYSLSLGNNSEDIILLSSTDLDARLQVSGVKAKYAALPPLSLAAANDEEPLTSSSLKFLSLSNNLQKARNFIGKLLDNNDSLIQNYSIFPLSVRQGFETSTGKQKSQPYLYLPTESGAQIQVYDPTKSEQVASIAIARTLQLGKVLFEEAIQDPVITQLTFSADSEWMVTVDETVTPSIDELLSKSDLQINLKFWADDRAANQGAEAWKLTGRVSNPHGVNVSVAAIQAAPRTYHNGLAFVTSCKDGALRIWRPRFPKIQTRQIEWSARHILEPTYSSLVSRSGLESDEDNNTDQVCLAWSPDGSVLLLGKGYEIHIVSVPTSPSTRFEIVRTLSGIVGSPLRGLGILDTSLVVLGETTLTVYDLLRDNVSWTANPGFTAKNARSLIAYGDGVFTVAVNYATKTSSSNMGIASNVYIFNRSSPVPAHIFQHSRPIAAVYNVSTASRQRFLIIDTDKLIFYISAPETAFHSPAKAEQVKISESLIVDEDEIPGVTAILNRKVGKFTVPEQAEKIQLTSTASESRANVVLNTSLVDEVFDGPEYAVGDFDNVFDKLLGAIGKKEA
ncbi:WD40-repeat-containing domain protein [Lipomyces japonicus]|uniref:WD40-repeat-containing domain protein n=1 Tax=Lipomyces japonicus TaxID=56871 RepID=UPI0034CEC138